MLYEQDGLTQAELSKRIQVEQPTMANTLNRMERDGLIRRQIDPLDKRRAIVHLTPRAKSFKNDLMDKARQVPGKALAKLSASDQDTLFRLLGQMLENLENQEP